MPPWLEAGKSRSVEWDRRCARALHRGADRPRLLLALVAFSRLGGAPLWFAAVGALWLGGSPLAVPALLLGAINLAVYWAVKFATRRERPFRRCEGIRECVRADDAFSFPSGHTLHAVAFAVLISAQYPALAPLLWAFAGLVAASRVVLGVHYPSDVIAGALLGAGSAWLVRGVF